MSFVTTPRAKLGFVLVFALTALFVLSFACGGDDEGDGGNGGGPTTPAGGGNGNGDGGGQEEFDISMTDNAFDPSETTVASGAEVTFNITNDGTAIHNMRVSGEDGEYNTDDDAVSDPDLFNAGDTGTLTWTAPDESGEIDFQCDFHTTDMTGTITVE